MIACIALVICVRSYGSSETGGHGEEVEYMWLRD